MQKYDKLKEIKDPAKDLVKDDIWSVDVPYPLPAVGAKVKVTGKYGFSFSKSSTGLVSDPVNGVMTYEKVEVLEPAPEKASFKNPRQQGAVTREACMPGASAGQQRLHFARRRRARRGRQHAQEELSLVLRRSRRRSARSSGSPRARRRSSRTTRRCARGRASSGSGSRSMPMRASAAMSARSRRRSTASDTARSAFAAKSWRVARPSAAST